MKKKYQAHFSTKRKYEMLFLTGKLSAGHSELHG